MTDHTNLIATGGQAFPVPNDANVNDQMGMTLRDYFAAKAMQGWLTGVDDPIIAKCAEISYKIADAMLEARK